MSLWVGAVHLSSVKPRPDCQIMKSDTSLQINVSTAPGSTSGVLYTTLVDIFNAMIYQVILDNCALKTLWQQLEKAQIWL